MNDFLNSVGRTFAMVATGALMSMALVITFFSEAKEVHVRDIWAILLIALFSGLANVVFLSNREPGPKGMLLRKAVHFAIILTGVLVCAVRLEWLEAGEPVRTFFFIGMFIAIYVVVVYLEHRQDQKTASLINQRLREFRKR